MLSERIRYDRELGEKCKKYLSQEWSASWTTSPVPSKIYIIPYSRLFGLAKNNDVCSGNHSVNKKSFWNTYIIQDFNTCAIYEIRCKKLCYIFKHFYSGNTILSLTKLWSVSVHCRLEIVICMSWKPRFLLGCMEWLEERLLCGH